MRISLILLLIQLSFFCMVAPGQEEPLKIVAPPAKSTVRAHVYYEDTGRAVKRTSVMLVSRVLGSDGERMAMTDAMGNLEIRDVRAGKYYAVINAPGVVSPLAYVDYRKSRNDSFDEQFAPFPAIVVDGITDVNVQMPARRGGAISGRISYSDGDAAIGVKVEILRKVGDEFLPTFPNYSIMAASLNSGAGVLQTDDRGCFRFAGLPAGEYIVKASENVVHATNQRNNYRGSFDSVLFSNGSMVDYFFQDALERSKAQILTVAFGQELSEINILIPDRELHRVGGKIVSASDKLPVRNVRIYFKRENEKEDGSRQGEIDRQYTYSDEQGDWAFKELPKGKYTLYAEADNSTLDRSGQAYGGSSQDNSVNAAMGNAMRAVNAAIAEASGKRAVEPPRRFARKIQEFTVEDKDISDLAVELKFGSVVAGSVDIEDGKKFPRWINLVVTSLDGKSSNRGSISNYTYPGDPNPGPVDRDFRIDGVGSGKMRLTVTASEDEYYVKSAMLHGVDILNDGFEIKDGEDLRNIKIVFAKDSGTLKGMMVDNDNQPVAGAKITLVPTDPSKFRNRQYYRTTRSSDSGEFEIVLPPFEYAVVSIPESEIQGAGEELDKWLAEAVKQAQKFKIEAGKVQKCTIKAGAKRTGS